MHRMTFYAACAVRNKFFNLRAYVLDALSLSQKHPNLNPNFIECAKNYSSIKTLKVSSRDLNVSDK